MLLNTKTLYFLIAAFFLVSCDANKMKDSASQVNSTFSDEKRHLNEVYKLEMGGSFSLTKNSRLIFEKVTEDSRCPKDAKCKWAGRVLMDFKYINHSGSKNFVIKFVPGRLDTKLHLLILDDKQLEVVGIFPIKEAKPVSQNEYTVEFQIKQQKASIK